MRVAKSNESGALDFVAKIFFWQLAVVWRKLVNTEVVTSLRENRNSCSGSWNQGIKQGMNRSTIFGVPFTVPVPNLNFSVQLLSNCPIFVMQYNIRDQSTGSTLI